MGGVRGLLWSTVVCCRDGHAAAAVAVLYVGGWKRAARPPMMPPGGRTRIIRPLAAATVILAIGGCTSGTRCQDMQFARLRPADRVVITTNVNETLRTISDPTSVA